MIYCAHSRVTHVVFTRRYRPADGPPDRPGLCPVSIDVFGVCPLYVRGMSDVCSPDGESRTQRRTVRRTCPPDSPADGGRGYYSTWCDDVYSDDVVTEY